MSPSGSVLPQDTPGSELAELVRQTRLSVIASGGGGEGPRPATSALPQQIFLQSMREEIEHFFDESDLAAELEEERRLFEQLKLLGQKLNEDYVSHEFPDEPAGPPLAWLKRLLRRLLWPVFRLVLGPRLHGQSYFNALLVQNANALAQLEVQVVSVQRLYKAHLSNLSRNLLRVVELLHQSDVRLNEKMDLLVEDLDRRLVALGQTIAEERRSPPAAP
jgi:hypothetical protein